MKAEILKQKGYNFLWIDDELWMWNIPAETKIQKGIAEQTSGNVLVAGYGLGVVHRFLEINEAVTSITTIEKYSEVIIECKKANIPIIGKVIIGDFLNSALPNHYNLIKKYDYVIGDIWAEIEPNSLPLYIAFKTKAFDFLKHDGKILAWGQDYFEYLINRK